MIANTFYNKLEDMAEIFKITFIQKYQSYILEVKLQLIHEKTITSQVTIDKISAEIQVKRNVNINFTSTT